MPAENGPINAMVLRALLTLHLRRMLRAGVKSGPPRLNVRTLGRPGLIAIFVLFVSWQIYSLAESWVSGHSRHTGTAVFELLQPVLASLSSVAFVIIFFYSFATLIGTFTDTRDLRLLLLSPIRPEVILGERILATSLGFSGMLLLLVPALFAVGVGVNLPIGFYPAVLAAILLLPLAPASLAVCMLILVIRWVPPARARTISTAVATGVSIAFFLGSRALYVNTRLGAPSLPSGLPSDWPSQLVSASGRGNLASALAYGVLTVVLALLFFGFATVVAARTFATGSGSYQEVSRRARILRSEEYPSVDVRSEWAGAVSLTFTGNVTAESVPRRSIRVRQPWQAISAKDWLTLRRDPQRMILFLYPLVIVGFNVFQVFSRGRSYQAGSTATTLLLLLLAALMLVNTTAPSVFGSEGRALMFLALAPVSARAIAMSKWLTAAFPPLVVIELASVGLTVYVKLSFLDVILVAMMLALITITLSGLSLGATIAWPRLDSTNPRRQGSAIGRGVSSLCGLLVCAAAGIVFFLGLFFWRGAYAILAVTVNFVVLMTIIIILVFLIPRLLERLIHSETLTHGDVR